MGFWNSLGKIALQAAPYVAAPFTAGASLYALPATQKLGEKWSAHDNTERAKKGLGPSNFDKWLGIGSNVAGLASGTGALGKFGSAAYTGAKAAGSAGKLASTAKGLSGWQNKLKQGGQIASMAMGGSPYAGAANYTGGMAGIREGEHDWENAVLNKGGLGGWQGALATGIGGLLNNRNPAQAKEDAGTYVPSTRGTPLSNQARGPVMPQGGYGYNQNPMNQLDQRNPNLAQSIFQGRQEAMQNQPWRAGYQTQVEDDGQIFTNQQPPIYPQYQPPNAGVGDMITQDYGQGISNQARRRNPELEEEYN